MHQIPCTSSRAPCRPSTRAPFGPKGCHRSKTLTSCSSQLDQPLEGPTLVAEAANRLSAAPEHTIHGLVASTSASTEQSPALTSEAVHQADSIVPHLTEQLGSQQSTGGVPQIIPRCEHMPCVTTEQNHCFCNLSHLLWVLQLART